MEAVLKRLCEAEPDLERFTKQVVITDDMRQRFEAKIEVGDVEVDERYKNAYICKFYIEGRDEYYISASIKKEKEKRTGFIFDVRNGKGEACEYFQKHGPENIQMSIVQKVFCKNENELRKLENDIVESFRTDPKSMRVNPSRCTKAKHNKFTSGKIYIVWHKNGSQIFLASTVKTLAEKKASFGVFQNRGQKSALFEVAETQGGIKNFEFTLLEIFPCNCLADLEMRQKLWMDVFPKQLQIGKVVLDTQQVSNDSLQSFLHNVPDCLKELANQVVITDQDKAIFMTKTFLEDFEVDERYSQAYIYRLFAEGYEEFYYGSSIKNPMEKRAAHVYDAKRNAPGKAYEFFRRIGPDNMKIMVEQQIDCQNETQLKLVENEYIERGLKDPNCLNHFLAITKKPKQNNRYRDGKIYIIFKEDCRLFYLGSTIQSLEHRKKNHDTIQNGGESALCKEAKQYGGISSFQIVLWENWPCNSKRQLEAREQFWKNLFPSKVMFNKQNALSTAAVKNEKRKLSSRARRESEEYKAKLQARKENESNEHKQARLAKARARPVTEARRKQQSEYRKARLLAEDAERREARLQTMRVKGKAYYENQKILKNAKRLLVRLNSAEHFCPKDSSLQKYQVSQDENGRYFSRLLGRPAAVCTA